MSAVSKDFLNELLRNELASARRAGIDSTRGVAAVKRILERRARLDAAARHLVLLLRARLVMGAGVAAALRLVATVCLGAPAEGPAANGGVALASALALAAATDRVFARGFPPGWSEDRALLGAFSRDFLGLDAVRRSAPDGEVSAVPSPWTAELRALERTACRTGVPCDRERRATLNRWAAACHLKERLGLRRHQAAMPAFELVGIGGTIILALAAFGHLVL